MSLKVHQLNHTPVHFLSTWTLQHSYSLLTNSCRNNSIRSLYLSKNAIVHKRNPFDSSIALQDYPFPFLPSTNRSSCFLKYQTLRPLVHSSCRSSSAVVRGNLPSDVATVSCDVPPRPPQLHPHLRPARRRHPPSPRRTTNISRRICTRPSARGPPPDLRESRSTCSIEAGDHLLSVVASLAQSRRALWCSANGSAKTRRSYSNGWGAAIIQPNLQ